MKRPRTFLSAVFSGLLACLSLPAVAATPPPFNTVVSEALAPSWGPDYTAVDAIAGDPTPPPGMFPLYASYFTALNQGTYINAIAVNASGEIYIAGRVEFVGSTPPALPAGNAYQGGYTDGFVAKFAADGHTLIYCQFVGSPIYDDITGIALDAAGNAYVSGFSVQSISLAGDGMADAFVGRLVQTGNSVAITLDFFGGVNEIDRGDDRATGIAVAPNGSIVTVGYTYSPDFPVVNAFDNSLGGTMDGFIRRYNPAFTLIQNSTFVGYAPDMDQLNSVDIGSDNSITVAGASMALTPLAREHVWVERFNAGLTSRTWQGRYAGNTREVAQDIRVLANGKTLVVGFTDSNDFVGGPSCPSGLDTSYGPDPDAFLMRLDSNGQPDYCSFLGGPGLQNATGVDIAENGDILVVGTTRADALAQSNSFLLRLNAPNYLSLDYSLVYGSAPNSDRPTSLVRAANRGVYVGGVAGGATFWPISDDAYQGLPPPRAGDKGHYALWFHDEDFPGRLRFTAPATASVTEAETTVTLTVERVLGTAGTVQVNYATANGSAVEPGDYTSRTGTLTFGPGVTSQPITITVRNDPLDEDNETFSVSLSNPTGGAVLGNTPSATVTIADDTDAPPTLSIAGCNPLEGNGSPVVNCRFVASLSGPSGKTISFRSGTRNGSAVAPGDYTAHSAVTRTIAASATTLNIDVPLVGDTISEGEETFFVDLNTLSNASAGTLSATGTIRNDDTAPVDNAVFVSQTVPASMNAGQSYAVRVRLRNTGDTSWTSANQYKLGAQNPQNNTTWDADGRIALPASVAPGAEVEFQFNVTAPTTPGSYNFQWRMLREGQGWFGANTNNVVVNVTSDRVFASGFQQ